MNNNLKIKNEMIEQVYRQIYTYNNHNQEIIDQWNKNLTIIIPDIRPLPNANPEYTSGQDDDFDTEHYYAFKRWFTPLKI
jgi:hypothetical protein